MWARHEDLDGAVALEAGADCGLEGGFHVIMTSMVLDARRLTP